MMSEAFYNHLSRRERQIMDVIFELGEATAAQIVERLPEPSSNSSVRILLGILEEKGYLKSRMGGATEVRGGRDKRLYTLTASAVKVLNQSKEVRNELWGQIPKIVLNGKV